MKKKVSRPNSSRSRPNANEGGSKKSSSKVWSSGASYSLTSKGDMTLWIKAFLIRYYEHLAVDHEHKNNILVYWQNAKGQEPIEKDGFFDFNHPENALLTQWILFKEQDDPDSTLFRKILTTNFFVSGKKHSVVLGGSAFREWLDNEESIIEELINAIKNGVSTEDQLAISHKYPFSSKLTSHPGEGVKLISIHFQESSNEENDEEPKETIEENTGFDDSIILSDMSTDMLDDSLISVKSVDIELEQSESTEIMCQDILQDLINQVTAVNKGESKIIVKENGTDINSKDNKVPLETYGKLNVKVKAEVKLLKQSIKAKDDEIKSLKKSLSDLQVKLKAETKKVSEVKQSRDSLKKLNDNLKVKNEQNTSKVSKFEKELESKQTIIDFLRSALNIPKETFDDTVSLAAEKATQNPSPVLTKAVESKSKVEYVTKQDEDKDVNVHSNSIENGVGTSKPKSIEPNITDTEEELWYEAKNNKGQSYFWNEKMIVSKKKPRGKIIFLPTEEGNSKNAIKLEGENKFKSSKICKFFQQDKCKFGNKCRYVHEKEHVPPRFKYNTRDKVDKSESVFRGDHSEISSHTVPTVRNTTTDSVNLQDLFTATKDLQQNTKSFLEQMNKQMSFLMTHVLQEKQLPKQIPIYPQALSSPVLPRMQALYQPTHTGLLNQYTLNHFP